MIGAASIAAARGLLAEPPARRSPPGWTHWARVRAVSRLDGNAMLAAVARDKKARAGSVPFILPTRIGEVVVEPDVSTGEIRDALRGMGVADQG